MGWRSASATLIGTCARPLDHVQSKRPRYCNPLCSEKLGEYEIFQSTWADASFHWISYASSYYECKSKKCQGLTQSLDFYIKNDILNLVRY